MADPSGFYLMHRGWQDNPVFRGEEFSRRDAFVWLIEEAAWKERRVAVPKGTTTLHRGQLSASLRFMAKAWKWTEPKVRRFIQSLVSNEIIDASTDAGQTLITIRNYDIYQDPANRPDAPTDARATQHRRSTDANEKEGKEGKEEIDDSHLSHRAKRATRLPDGWKPSRLDRSTAAGKVAAQRGTEWMQRTFESFENYWRAASGRGAAKLDWQRTWANWVTAQDQREGRNGRTGNHKSTSGYGSTVDAALAAIADAGHS